MVFDAEVIRANFQRVKEEINQAAADSGRNPSDVKLLVVTKSQPVGTIRAVIAAGAKFIGENYPEETIQKLGEIPERDQVKWHMIGHLQSRKAKLVAEHFDCFHSLDSLSLAEKLSRLLVERNQRLPVMMEINVSGEESKYGWQAADEKQWGDLIEPVLAVSQLTNLDLCGLMTMPPLFDDPDAARPFFERLRMLRDFLTQETGLRLTELSMGTSADFRAAVQEGSTYVRVGTAIVGPRAARGLGSSEE